MRTDFFSADGVIHIVRAYDKPIREHHSPALNHSPRIIEKMNRDRDICLNCTKEKCDGNYECFREQKRSKQ